MSSFTDKTSSSASSFSDQNAGTSNSFTDKAHAAVYSYHAYGCARSYFGDLQYDGGQLPADLGHGDTATQFTDRAS